MKSALRHGDSIDSMSELNSFDSSRGDEQDNTHSHGECPSPLYQNTNGGNARLSSQGLYQLTKDFRTFSVALTSLKAVYLDERSSYIGSMKVIAHERLTEVLQVLRLVIDKHPEITSTDVLNYASELIEHVKSYNYEQDGSNVKTEIFRAINKLALIFSNSVSECLMGDEMNSPMLAASSPLLDNSAVPNTEQTECDEISQPLSQEIEPSTPEVDTEECLLKLENGLEMAFDRAKILSKYLGELISYVKKKANLEMEHSRNMLKLSQQTKQVLSEQSFLPFQSLYCTNLDHEREYASNCQSFYQALNMKYAESLLAKKAEHDKKRKQMRESWSREKKRTEETISNMKKAKQNYYVKMQEYQKARDAALKAEGEQLGGQSQQAPKINSSSSSSALGAFYTSTTGKVDKKKKQEEGSNTKAISAEQTYRRCIKEANKRVKELEKIKALYLQQLKELMEQCDQTAKNVTQLFFQLHYELFAPLPVQFQAMSEDTRRYDPGYQFVEYVRSLPPTFSRRDKSFKFEPYPNDNNAAFIGPGGYSDTESSSSRSLDDLSASGDITRHNHPRRHSTEDSLSSDDILDDRPSGSATLTPGDFVEPSPILPKLTKNAYLLAANVKGAFSGKKASKASLYGVDFQAVAQGCPDGIPFLVKKCVSEIDNRALSNKGIYRMNGVKNRVERIYSSQFENFPEKLDLSQYTPHDVTGSLKHFLRQLSEPLLLYKNYDVFLDIAKEFAQLVDSSSNETVNSDKDEPSFDAIEPYLKRLRDAVESLPFENRNTLQYIISHLSRVANLSEANKMTASNLAIVFGPTLLRKTLIDGNESLDSLADLPHQTRAVELLILHKDFVFGIHIIKSDPNTGAMSLESPSFKMETDETSTSNDVISEEGALSTDEKRRRDTPASLDFGSSLSNSIGLSENDSLPTPSSADFSPSSPGTSLDESEDVFRSNRNFRKKAIRYSTPPPLSALNYNHSKQTKHRKKSHQKSSDKPEIPEQQSPIKEYFSSSSLQDMLGTLARRRFSRDNPKSNLAAPYDPSRPAGSASRKSSLIQQSAPITPRSPKEEAGPTSRKSSSAQQFAPLIPRSSKEETGFTSRKSSLVHQSASYPPRSSTIEAGPVSRKSSLIQGSVPRSSEEEGGPINRKSSSTLHPIPPPRASKEGGSSSRRPSSLQTDAASQAVFLLENSQSSPQDGDDDASFC